MGIAARITKNKNGQLNVPDMPIIPFIEGDGIGPDIWRATKMVLDASVRISSEGQKRIDWLEVLAGEKGQQIDGDWLSDDALDTIKEHVVAIKGPLTTPVGKGIRSINVAIRNRLDLYACVRPVKYIDPVPSPLKEPEKVDMVVFRENTEDVYAGIEWESDSSDAHKVIEFLQNQMGVSIPENAGIGIKPMSAKNTKRLVASAIQYALEHG
jgi:isocitrate dehydrogenase